MGYFNVTGAISKSVITGDNDIVLFFGIRCASSRINDRFAPGFDFTPIALPIFGKYDGYGGIMEIQRDANIELIESWFGSDIDTILSVVDDRVVGRYVEKDKAELVERLVEFEKKFNSYYGNEQHFQLGTAIEHRFVYDIMVNDEPHYFGYDFDRSYEKTIEVGYEEIKDDANLSYGEFIIKIKDLNSIFKEGREEKNFYRSITYLAPWAAKTIWCESAYFQNCSEYMFAEYFLYLYRNESNDYNLFNPTLKDSFLGILKFMDYLAFNSIMFRTHNYHGQDEGFKSILKFHTTLADFYKNKVKEQEEYENYIKNK